MAYCDSCGNFDDQDMTLEESKEHGTINPTSIITGIPH